LLVAPRVSVVIPMYNAADFLAAAVESVFAQTFTDWELVLSDDGSRDNTLAVALEYVGQQGERVRLVKGEVNSGAGQARNRGAAATDRASEFIIFLDADDAWEPHALARLIDVLERHPTAPAAHALVRFVDPRGNEFPSENAAQRHRRELRNGALVAVSADGPTTFEALVLENYPVTPGTMLIRRRVWQALDGYANETRPCEDWDFNLRLSRHGPIVFLDEVVLNWRRHPAATSLNSRRWRDAYLLVRKRAMQARENTPAQRAVAVAAFRLTCSGAWADVGRQFAGGRLRATFNAFARVLTFEAAFWSARRTAAT
jgi:glycosyltransferase involved in cell wall biosynthesis